MPRWRETPDWSMSTASTMSLTACSPESSASTMRRRVGSARVWKTSVCILIHMHEYAYNVNLADARVRLVSLACDRRFLGFDAQKVDPPRPGFASCKRHRCGHQ